MTSLFPCITTVELVDCCSLPRTTTYTYVLASPMQSDASSAFLQLGSPGSAIISPMSPSATTTSSSSTSTGGYTVQKRPAPRKLNRPATAPSADDLLLLPSRPSRHPDNSTSSFPSPVPELPPKSPAENSLCPTFKVSEDEPDPYSSFG